MEYRTKANTIEAFRLGYDQEPEWYREDVESRRIEHSRDYKGNIRGSRVTVWENFRGMVDVAKGDWLLKDFKGNYHVMSDERFRAFFEPADQMRI